MRFIQEHRLDSIAQLALQRSKYPTLNQQEWLWAIQQIEGWQRTKDKLPSMGKMDDWWYPVRLSCEQCSSEATARYKRLLIERRGDIKRITDLTGGAGVDTWFMGEGMDEVNYVEHNEELCRLAQHNLPLGLPHVTIHNDSAEHYIEGVQAQSQSIVFIDPARRDKNGGKVFRLEDCEPNVTLMIDDMRKKFAHIMIKLSPMLDISAAIHSLGGQWDIHVVGYKNEVKELLLTDGEGQITAIDLAGQQSVCFTMEEENQAKVVFGDCLATYLYEPNAMILKAGAYKWMSEKYGVYKLGKSTHLYTSDQYIEDWPGRIFKVTDEPIVKKGKYNIVTRNYAMGAEALKKKLGVSDGGNKYIIGTRIGDKYLLIVAESVQ